MTTSTATFTPSPGAAPLPRMIGVQTAYEVRNLLRNGEQLLLTLIIPVALLVLFASAPLLDVGPGRRVDFLAPGKRYEAQIYADGPGADYITNTTALAISKKVVTSKDSLEFDMAPGGGAAVRFKALD